MRKPVAASEDQPFRHYSLQHRIVTWISARLFDRVTYTVRRGLLRGMKRKGGLGWVPEFFSRGAESKEHQFLKGLDFHGQVVYDVGAFHGLMTLFFARHAKQVVCYEPNTRNHARLIENLRLNGLNNVVVRKVGLGSKPEMATMVASPLMPGGASIERRTVAALLNSNRPVLSEEISITTLDDDIRSMSSPAPDLVKIDVEGGELATLEGARNTLLTRRPRLFLEMHGETINEKTRKVAEIVAFLTDLGYASIQHVESGTLITAANSALAARGHLYCSWG